LRNLGEAVENSRVASFVLWGAITLSFSLILPNLIAGQASATANLAGSVKSADGRPLEGVGVSAREAGERFTTTVYSDQSGAYSFPQLAAGNYKIWAQAVGFETAVTQMEVSGGADKKSELTLGKLTDFQKQLSGPEMLASLPGDSPSDRRMKAVFANICTSCHPSSFTLQNRFDSAGWNAIVTLMERVSPTGVAAGPGAPPSALGKAQGYVVGAYKDELVAYLTKVRGPDSPALNLTAFPRPSGDATRIVVTEYDLPRADKPTDWVLPHNGSDWSEGTPSRYEGRGPHDVVVDGQGIVWFADDVTPGRTVGKLDPRTGLVTDFALMNSTNHADSTHAIALDRDGNVWAADDTMGVPIEFAPETEKFKTYQKPNDLPRAGDFVTVDSQGNIWAPYSDGAVKLDPQTGKYTIYTIPTKGKSTYGIDADKNDNIWIAQPTADKIAFIDGQTGETSEIAVNPVDTKGIEVTDKDREVYATMGGQNTSPFLQVGPRRLAADKTGDFVWVAEHFANRLAKVDIRTRKITEYPMPHPYMMPYAIAVDKNHMVWATSIASDRIVKFNPFTEKYTEYDLPTRGTESRHIYADNRTDPPTIWIPYDRTNKIARVQFRTAGKPATGGN
jgi:streptogramin lyase